MFVVALVRRLLCYLAMALALVVPGTAHANGAFPDSLQILVPADHPHQIILVTNFGLIISEDDGATWDWTCEPNKDDNAYLYQMGAAPSDRLFAVLVTNGLIYSDDVACTWKPAGGALTTAIASDAFPDPASPARVFAIAAPRGDALTVPSVYRSDDGGLTFGPALYTVAAGGNLLGVEAAVSQPATVYAAAYQNSTADPTQLNPLLVTSSDGGAHWIESSLIAALGPLQFRIIAVDRTDPLRLFLRVSNPQVEDKLAVSFDGGKSFQEPITVDQSLTSFLRLASGTILVGGTTMAGAVGYRSSDGGVTFQSWPHPPYLRGMAERAGKLFVAADNFLDGFAVGVSTDEGLTFTSLLTYDKVKAIKPCVQAICQGGCETLAGLTLWPPAVCGDDGTTTAAAKSGCGCGFGAHDVGHGDGADDGFASRESLPLTGGLVVAGGLVWLSRRTRRRARNR